MWNAVTIIPLRKSSSRTEERLNARLLALRERVPDVLLGPHHSMARRAFGTRSSRDGRDETERCRPARVSSTAARREASDAQIASIGYDSTGMESWGGSRWPQTMPMRA